MMAARRGTGAGPRIAILGAGLAGIAVGLRLKKRGFSDFTLFERADDVGGTWHQNRYPGLRCDVSSEIYCYSFEPNPDWSHTNAPRDEIAAYFRHVVVKYGLTPHIRLSTPVRGARFDAASGHWDVTLAKGEVERFDFVIGAWGLLNEPQLPDIAGLDDFEGKAWHSAHWSADHDVAGRRVAVIGTAASAVQIVPEVAKVAASVDVYQRTPNWVLPRSGVPADGRRPLWQRLPGIAALHSRVRRVKTIRSANPVFKAFMGDADSLAALRGYAFGHLSRKIPEGPLRDALTPSFDPGCKRLLVSDEFYPTLLAPTVELVTDPIDRIVATGIVAGGRERPADRIIFCTGYRMPHFQGSIPVHGRDGVSLEQKFDERLESYLGVAIEGFPNFFMINGPNGILGYSSVTISAEFQAAYIVRLIETARARRRASIEIRPEVARAYNDRIQARLRGSSWAGSCPSYYHDETGRVVMFYPGTAFDLWKEYRRAGLSDYR